MDKRKALSEEEYQKLVDEYAEKVAEWYAETFKTKKAKGETE